MSGTLFMFARDIKPEELSRSSLSRSSMPLIPSMLEGDAYASAWKAFREASDQRAVMLRWFEEHAPSIIPPAEVSAVMSVGAANGSFDLAVIPYILRGTNNLFYSICEPNSALRDEFDRSTEVFEPRNRVAFKMYSNPWQDVVPEKQFDLVLMSHCLYYLPNPEAAVVHASEFLAGEGKILVFNATSNGLAQIRDRFTSSLTGVPYHYLTAEEISTSGRALGLDVTTSLIPSVIDVSGGVGPFPDMNLLSFLVNCDLRGAPPSVAEDISAFLIGISDQYEGKFLVHHPVAAMVITKQKQSSG